MFSFKRKACKHKYVVHKERGRNKRLTFCNKCERMLKHYNKSKKYTLKRGYSEDIYPENTKTARRNGVFKNGF